MTEITLTYKGVTIKETFDRLLTQQSYSDHINRWFNIIDERVQSAPPPVAITINGNDLLSMLDRSKKVEDMLDDSLPHLCSSNDIKEETAIDTLTSFLSRRRS